MSIPTCPTNTIIGDESCVAAWMPTAAFDRARSARDERNAGPSDQLAVRLRHVRGAAFVPAYDERQPLADVVQRVEHGEVAFAGNAERVRRALDQQVGDENLAAGSGCAWQAFDGSAPILRDRRRMPAL